MFNFKHFFLYSILVSLSLITSVFFQLGNIFMKSITTKELLQSILIALFLLFIFMCLSSWINNIFFYTYMKRKGYCFLSLSLYPFLWIKDNKKKNRLNIEMNSLINITSAISLKSINNKMKYKKYIMNYQRCINNLKKIHILEFLVFGLFVLVNPILCIYLCLMQITMICLYKIESSNILMDSLYNFGMKEKNTYCIFLNLTLENHDKTEIYKMIQDDIQYETYSHLLKKNFLNQLLIDSISEDKDYLTLKTKAFLENLFLNDNERVCYQIEYIRNISLYYIYLIQSNNHNDLIQKNVINNWNQIKETHNRSMLGKKVLNSIKKEVKLDANNLYELYNKKTKTICYKMSILE